MHKYLFILSLFLCACSPDDVVNKYDDGSTKEIFSVNKEGAKNGPYKSYREDGTLEIESNYKNGQLDGLRNIYFADGKTLEIAEVYKNNTLDGAHAVYYSSGSKLLDATFINGKMEGLLTKYAEDGDILETVTFKNNIESGPFKEYYENGQVQWEGNFLNGDTEFGLLKQFDESGKLIKKMMCDSLGVCQTIWTPEKGDIDPKEFKLTKPTIE